MSDQPLDLSIPRLEPATRPSPIRLSSDAHDCLADYVRDDHRVLLDIDGGAGQRPPAVGPTGWPELAGPREHVHFDSRHVHAAMVTCGGLCPGLNSVIRALVLTLWHRYGVRRISGIRYGYQGLLLG